MLSKAAWFSIESSEFLLTVMALTVGTSCFPQSPVLGFCPGDTIPKTISRFSAVKSVKPLVLDFASLESSPGNVLPLSAASAPARLYKRVQHQVYIKVVHSLEYN